MAYDMTGLRPLGQCRIHQPFFEDHLTGLHSWAAGRRSIF